MSFAQTDFPRQTGVFYRGEWRRTGSAVVTADGDDVRSGFGNAGGDDANARGGNKFDANARARMDRTQIVNQLSQVLDAINMVLRRRRKQRSPWLCAAKCAAAGVAVV